MSRWNEEQLGRLLGSLPPAPAAWTQAARELPRTRRELAEPLARLEADARAAGEALRDLDVAFGPVAPERRAARAALVRVRLGDRA
jgi:hypothetical protein